MSPRLFRLTALPAVFIGTATIFTNLGTFMEATGAGLEAEWPWVLPGADQADD